MSQGSQAELDRATSLNSSEESPIRQTPLITSSVHLSTTNLERKNSIGAKDRFLYTRLKGLFQRVGKYGVESSDYAPQRRLSLGKLNFS
jgi:hypothetical protein